jgi:hypothetical protein
VKPGKDKKEVLISVVARIIAQHDGLISDEPTDPKDTAIEVVETLYTLGVIKGSR